MMKESVREVSQVCMCVCMYVCMYDVELRREDDEGKCV